MHDGNVEPEEWLKRHGARRIALFGGPTSLEKSGALERLTRIPDLALEVYTEGATNPSFDDAKAASAFLAEASADAIVAVGGGSTLDLAKLARSHLARGMPTSIASLLNGEDAGRRLPLLAIPTTIGSGAECTQFAVIYDGGRKHSLDHCSVRPDAWHLDWKLTRSLPYTVAAASSFDALSQAIESHWSAASSNASRRYSEQAMSLAWTWMIDSVQSPNGENRSHMLKAAHLAGQAINLTRTTAPHALSYALTMSHGIQHGHAVALTLPAIARFNGEDMPHGDRQANIRAICRILGVTDVDDLAQEFQCRMQSVNLSTRIRDEGVAQASLDKLAVTVNTQRLGNNPRPMNAADVARMYKEAW